MVGSEKGHLRLRERDKNLVGALFRHAHFLRSAMTLAASRHEQLDRTLLRLGHSEMPTGKKAFHEVQAETAKEIGGIRTMMYLDAPQEIMKFHYGPLQVALCLLDAIIARYRQLSRDKPAFQDDELDAYCSEHADFLQTLKATRDSLLHERHDKVGDQEAFVKAFRTKGQDRIVSSLIEGSTAYEAYLRRLASLFPGAGNAGPH